MIRKIANSFLTQRLRLKAAWVACLRSDLIMILKKIFGFFLSTLGLRKKTNKIPASKPTVSSNWEIEKSAINTLPGTSPRPFTLLSYNEQMRLMSQRTRHRVLAEINGDTEDLKILGQVRKGEARVRRFGDGSAPIRNVRVVS